MNKKTMKQGKSGIDTYVRRYVRDCVNRVAEVARAAEERKKKHKRPKHPVRRQARGPDASTPSCHTAPGRES